MSTEEYHQWDVVEEHLDEAEFLVEQWLSARRSPQYTLDELASGPEHRLVAHTDGLVINGPLALERVGWPVLEGGGETPRVAAAALALLDAGDFRVLEVLDQPQAEGEEEDDEPVDHEAARLAGLRELAQQLDALETDDEQRTAVAEYELGPEAWRQSALGTVSERLATEEDEARALELGEIEVLLQAHAPPTGDGDGEDEHEDEGEDAEWAELSPEEREERRQAELQEVRDQLAASEDEREREGLRELEQTLLASAPDPEEAADDGDEAADGEDGDEDDEPELDPRAEGLALALALSSHAELGEKIRARAAKTEGASLALLLEACADRGLNPGAAVDRGLGHEEPAVVCAALRAAVFGERTRLLATVEARLQHRSAAVRAAAMDTALVWGSRSAWELALQGYRAPEAGAVRAWIACLGDDRHVQALMPLLDDEALRHDVLWALGLSGRVPAVEACLPWLDDDDEITRRLAGEAVAAIVGLDLEDETLWEQEAAAEPPPEIEGDAPEQDEDDLDAELGETPESELPLPNAEAIREWWKQRGGAFAAGKRYLLGKELGREGPGWALPRLSCRRVDAVAREVVARSQGVGRWPGRVSAVRHQQAVGALVELGRQAGVMQGDRR